MNLQDKVEELEGRLADAAARIEQNRINLRTWRLMLTMVVEPECPRDAGDAEFITKALEKVGALLESNAGDPRARALKAKVHMLGDLLPERAP